MRCKKRGLGTVESYMIRSVAAPLLQTVRGVKVAAAVGVSLLPVTRSARCDAALCRSGTAPLRLSAGRNTCCVQGHSVNGSSGQEEHRSDHRETLSL